MDNSGEQTGDSLSYSKLVLVDQLSDRFERAIQEAIQNGRVWPSVEEYLGDTREPIRSDLRKEFLRVEASCRQRVEELSAAHAEGGDDFGSQEGTMDHQVAAPANAMTEVAGTVIAGRYKLLEAIGEGGMGTVYLASQAEPVKRQVALKLIKAGMDSRAFLARFDAERQALAVMDHPNIARVYDGGTTATGQPFFVMELVQGVPVTEYCDRKHLPLRTRLELFVSVCQAVQHAHQKGIIHRDLKPGNVLVTEVDGQPTPKVIDFGVAKATQQKLTDMSLADTEAIVGTPAYMSPEQADPTSMDIDTRTDVYALGVMLYELLVGSQPIDAKQFKHGAMLEMLRIVREVDPPRPSTKLSSAEDLPNIAANRSIEPARLAKALQGELDWVVMKALEKDRTRRYETANGLSRDIQRYLSDEVVEARPPSVAYRLRKFARRHRVPVIAAGLVLAALLAGMAGTTFGFIRADQERWRAENALTYAEAKRADAETQQRRAEAGEKLADDRFKQVEAEKRIVEDQKRIAQAVRDFLQHKLLGQADTEAQADQLILAGQSPEKAKFNPTIRELLDRAALELASDKIEANFRQQPLLQAELLMTVGDTYLGVGEYHKAIALLTRAAELRKTHLGADDPETLSTLGNVALAQLRAGNYSQAIEMQRSLRDVEVAKFGANDPLTLTTLNNLATAYLQAGKPQQAIEILEQAYDARVKKGASPHVKLTTLNNLATAYLFAGNLPRAIELNEQVWEARRKTLGSTHPVTTVTAGNLGMAYMQAGNAKKAIELLGPAREACLKNWGPTHPYTLTVLANLAMAYMYAGNYAKAIELVEPTHGEFIKAVGADHPESFIMLNNLATAYEYAGKYEQAIEILKPLLDTVTVKLGDHHPTTINTVYNLAGAYLCLEDKSQAVTYYERAATALEKQDFAHLNGRNIILFTVNGYVSVGQFDKAVAWQRKWLAAVKKRSGATSVEYSAELGLLGEVLVRGKEYAEAEPVLRECLELREKLRAAKKQVGPWNVAMTKSNLGVALLGQKKHAEAEPLLVAGYQGLKENEKAVPSNARDAGMLLAIQGLIDLARATNKADDVKKWQAERAKYPAQKPAEKK